VGALEEALPSLQAALDAAKEEAARQDNVSNAEDEQSESVPSSDVESGEAATEVAAAVEAEAGSEANNPGEAKAVVSEYAKWMEGAGSTPGAIEGETTESTTKTARKHVTITNGLENLDTVSGLVEDDEEDEEEDYDGEDRDEDDEEVATSVTDDTPLGKAQAAVKSNQEATKALTKKIDLLGQDFLGYSSLLSGCLEKTGGEHTYKLCFFNKADQGHTLLGKWSGFTGPKAGAFKNGHMCPGGPARQLKVSFECGSEAEVLDITEPSRCVYSATVAHPGACDEADRQELLEPSLRHPKDEL